MNKEQRERASMIGAMTVIGGISVLFQTASTNATGASGVPIRPVELLLYTSAYMIGVLAFVTLIVFEFHVDREYPRIILAPLAVIGMFFFLLAYGTQNFEYPFPGFFAGLGVILILFSLGVWAGWLRWGVSDGALLHLSDDAPNDEPKRRKP